MQAGHTASFTPWPPHLWHKISRLLARLEGRRSLQVQQWLLSRPLQLPKSLLSSGKVMIQQGWPGGRSAGTAAGPAAVSHSCAVVEGVLRLLQPVLGSSW